MYALFGAGVVEVDNIIKIRLKSALWDGSSSA